MSRLESRRLSFAGAGEKALTAPVNSKRQRRQTNPLNYSHMQNIRGAAQLLDGRLDKREMSPARSPIKKPRRSRTEEQADGFWIWKQILLVLPDRHWAQDPVSRAYVGSGPNLDAVQSLHPSVSSPHLPIACLTQFVLLCSAWLCTSRLCCLSGATGR